MKILFIGDIVGRVGRRMVKENINSLVKKYDIDFVIANGENVTHGKGLIRHHYDELIQDGVDVITLGNHYKSKNEILKYLDFVDCLIRPYNLIEKTPGVGTAIYDVNGVSIRVTNLLGSAFMVEPVNDPYYSILEILDDEEEANIHIVDFHAEATGEKYSFAYAVDGKVSAVLGTHTHVQTKDARILENGTAYISDVGMTGFADGILGCTKESVVNKNLFGKGSRYEVPDEGRGLLSAVVLHVDDTSGKCLDIFPIYLLEEK